MRQSITDMLNANIEHLTWEQQTALRRELMRLESVSRDLQNQHAIAMMDYGMASDKDMAAWTMGQEDARSGGFDWMDLAAPIIGGVASGVGQAGGAKLFG